MAPQELKANQPKGKSGRQDTSRTFLGEFRRLVEYGTAVGRRPFAQRLDVSRLRGGKPRPIPLSEILSSGDGYSQFVGVVRKLAWLLEICIERQCISV